MIDLNKLSTDWSLIDGEGLVRVVPIESYSTGFVLMAHIGQLADSLEYYPEVTLARDKVTIVIADDDEAKAIQIATSIDSVLNAPSQEEKPKKSATRKQK